ncbi:tether containing UBX domain for GLUT4-like [Artemia franciscana]|uniref:tether containing UBX domain for GLUT4-like n=1 Tax=Artemia franciscana TaxID=6661 RepID=UPI0032D9CD12
MSSVTVLCPNGQRVNVKVGPNTVVAQIIEQACIKYSYEPCQFDLKHIKRVLKPDSTVRFEQIPNNAQLELVPVERKRRETSVQVFVQLPSGERLSSEHTPDGNISSFFALKSWYKV